MFLNLGLEFYDRMANWMKIQTHKTKWALCNFEETYVLKISAADDLITRSRK